MSISRDLKSINPQNIKALAMDLDGTILASGAILTERTARAIDACRQRGIQIIITTGRSPESAERFRLALGAEGPMVYLNGAKVIDMPKAEVINAVPLNDEAALFCVDLAREMNVYCQLYISGTETTSGGISAMTILMAERDGPERQFYFEHTKIFAELGDLKEALRRAGSYGCSKCMFVAEPEILFRIRPLLEQRLGKNVYIARTFQTYLEVMDAMVSKGQGLKFIMERNSWKPEEVIAFGDEENDIPMSEVAGFFAVPASSKDAVKEKASFVIGSNEEDGVAAFLEELFGL